MGCVHRTRRAGRWESIESIVGQDARRCEETEEETLTANAQNKKARGCKNPRAFSLGRSRALSIRVDRARRRCVGRRSCARFDRERAPAVRNRRLFALADQLREAL